MSKKTAERIQKELAEPFPAKDIEWRVSRVVMEGKKVIVLAYVTARATRERLNQVCGVFGWRISYHFGPNKEYIGRLELKDPESGEWVFKEDGSDQTDFEAVKGGLSSAMKRAGYAWGVGEYLYDLDESWTDVLSDKGPGRQYFNGNYKKDGKVVEVKGYFELPRLPAWAIPATAPTTWDELKAWCQKNDKLEEARKLKEGGKSLQEVWKELQNTPS